MDSDSPDDRSSVEPNAEPNPYEVAPSSMPVGPTFRLSTLMLTVTLIAVCLGIGRWFPGLAVGIFLLVTPAFLRTVLAGRRLRGEGYPATIEEKIFIFFASLGIVVAIVVAAGGAFYATCWAGFMGGAAVSEAAGAKGYDPIGYGLVLGVIVGGIAGLAALIVAIRFLWPYRDF